MLVEGLNDLKAVQRAVDADVSGWLAAASGVDAGRQHLANL